MLVPKLEKGIKKGILVEKSNIILFYIISYYFRKLYYLRFIKP